MLGAYPNLLVNSAYQQLWLGEGPWTAPAYTAPRWKFEREGAPTATARMRTLPAGSADKRLRGRRCIHIDVAAIDVATQDVTIRQRVDDAYRLGQSNLRLTVPVYGPGGATFTSWFTRGSVNAGPLFTTKGVTGGTVVTGTGQAGGASTITLASGASASDDAYNGRWIEITAGTGLGQMRLISDYVGATKVLTVDLAWATQPDATSVYKIANLPEATMVSIRKFTPDISLDYCIVQTFGSPSQPGTFMVGPADFQIVSVSGEHRLQFCEPPVEAVRLWDRYYPVRAGQVMRTSTVSGFPLIQFPVEMRVEPSYTPLITADMDLLVDTTGATVASSATITNTATNITVNGARVVFQNGWTGLTNSGDVMIEDPGLVGCFVADY
jgi:hypothetical protein